MPVAARELYTPFATGESVLLDAALLLQWDRSSPSDHQRVSGLLGVLVNSAENASPAQEVWQVLARAANLLAWHEGQEVTDDLHERIRAGLTRSVGSAPSVLTVWGYEERTEAGRHCFVYHHAVDYLLDRAATIPFRLGCAMTESLHAWEADMLEMHPDVLATHEVTPTWSPAPVGDDVTGSDEMPFEADFDGDDHWVLDDVSRWMTMSAARERLLTFRMAINQLCANHAPVPNDVVRRLLASAAAVGSQRPNPDR